MSVVPINRSVSLARKPANGPLVQAAVASNFPGRSAGCRPLSFFSPPNFCLRKTFRDHSRELAGNRDWLTSISADHPGVRKHRFCISYSECRHWKLERETAAATSSAAEVRP